MILNSNVSLIQHSNTVRQCKPGHISLTETEFLRNCDVVSVGLRPTGKIYENCKTKFGEDTSEICKKIKTSSRTVLAKQVE